MLVVGKPLSSGRTPLLDLVCGHMPEMVLLVPVVWGLVMLRGRLLVMVLRGAPACGTQTSAAVFLGPLTSVGAMKLGPGLVMELPEAQSVNVQPPVMCGAVQAGGGVATEQLAEARRMGIFLIWAEMVLLVEVVQWKAIMAAGLLVPLVRPQRPCKRVSVSLMKQTGPQYRQLCRVRKDHVSQLMKGLSSFRQTPRHRTSKMMPDSHSRLTMRCCPWSAGRR
mmetsp:Transcript_71216/g.166835  ORF Transcript_71216/g.166835 Transcript_71216/m.166835 type:complete len:222 (+) Transcript_71216:459-1124(+)